MIELCSTTHEGLVVPKPAELGKSEDSCFVLFIPDSNLSFLNEVEVLGFSPTFDNDLIRVKDTALEIAEDWDDEVILTHKGEIVVIEEQLEIYIVVLEHDKDQVVLVLGFQLVEETIDGDHMVDSVLVLCV